MSNDMREKIAAIVQEINLDAANTPISAYELADTIAQAILDALPGMVPPLVWYDDNGVWSGTSSMGRFYYVKDGAWSNPDDWETGQEADDESAKAAANAHHVAALMVALGVTQEGE